MRKREIRSLEVATKDSLSKFASKLFSIETRRMLCIQGSFEKEAAPVQDCVASGLQRIMSDPEEMHGWEPYVVKQLE